MGPQLVLGQLDHEFLRRCDAASVRPTSGDSGYDNGAIVPFGEWSPLTARELQRLRPDSTPPDSVLVELIRHPLPNFTTDDWAGRLEAAARIAPLDGCWPTQLLGCTASPGRRLTTTEDSATGLRIGLHLDNFDRLPYPRRHESRRRLCLNLGPGPRYLLLADQDVRQICRTPHRDLNRHYPHTDDVRRYVTEGHPLRCLRIRLEPGDGYIAPTEFLPHDGSTMGVEQESVAAFWLGPDPAGRFEAGLEHGGSLRRCEGRNSVTAARIGAVEA